MTRYHKRNEPNTGLRSKRFYRNIKSRIWQKLIKTVMMKMLKPLRGINRTNNEIRQRLKLKMILPKFTNESRKLLG